MVLKENNTSQYTQEDFSAVQVYQIIYPQNKRIYQIALSPPQPLHHTLSNTHAHNI